MALYMIESSNITLNNPANELEPQKHYNSTHIILHYACGCAVTFGSVGLLGLIYITSAVYAT